MLPIILSLIFVLALALASAYVGIQIVRAIRDQFDELLPQRMVDYSGFIDGVTSRDWAIRTLPLVFGAAIGDSVLMAGTITIYIDADACPVKDEVYKVAVRYGLQTFVVANAHIQIPTHPLISRVIVDAGPDIADDWIAQRCGVGDIVITQDIPLADRALKAGAQAIGNNGKPFTPDSIGSALAGREIGEHLRAMGMTTNGPKSFGAADRSRFLQELDAAVHRAKRAMALAAIKR